MKNWLILTLRVLTTPRYWLREGIYNKSWDELLNILLDQKAISEINEYFVEINDVRICTQSYFSDPGRLSGTELICSRKTAFKFEDKIIEYQLYEVAHKCNRT